MWHVTLNHSRRRRSLSLGMRRAGGSGLPGAESAAYHPSARRTHRTRVWPWAHPAQISQAGLAASVIVRHCEVIASYNMSRPRGISPKRLSSLMHSIA